jgi:hypothetical protein
VDAFDADVLIYAAIPDHPLGRRVAALFSAEPAAKSGMRDGVGSVLLLPELLAKPLKDGEADAVKTHLATAVSMGARRFITNNRRDFRAPMTEIDITFPADLPGAGD